VLRSIRQGRPADWVSAHQGLIVVAAESLLSGNRPRPGTHMTANRVLQVAFMDSAQPGGELLVVFSMELLETADSGPEGLLSKLRRAQSSLQPFADFTASHPKQQRIEVPLRLNPRTHMSGCVVFQEF
jgi:hypothetical protein